MNEKKIEYKPPGKTQFNNVGKRYCKLVVVAPTDMIKNKDRLYKLKCDCGNEILSTLRVLDGGKGHGKGSCGKCCLDGTIINPGDKFGELTAVKFVKMSNRRSVWEWQCECGRHINAGVDNVLRGSRRSCGCRKKSAKKKIEERDEEAQLFMNYLIHTDKGYKEAVQNEVKINDDAKLCQQLGITYGELQKRRYLGTL